MTTGIERGDGAKFVVNSAPTTTPMNSELYASLLTSARTMAMTGGSSDHAVSARDLPLAHWIAAATTSTSIAAMTMMRTSACEVFFFMVLSPSQNKNCVMTAS